MNFNLINKKIDGKIAIVGTAGLIIIISLIISVFFCINKSQKYRGLKQEYIAEYLDLDSMKVKYRQERENYQKIYNIYQNEVIKLERLNRKLDIATIGNTEQLTEALYRITELLELKIEYSRPNITERVDETRQRISIPIIIEGQYSNIVRFIYVLENSKEWLFEVDQNNRFIMSKNDNGIVNTRFILSAYLEN